MTVSHTRKVAALAMAMLAACTPSGGPAANAKEHAADSTAPAMSAIPTLPKVGPVETDSGPPVRFDSTAPRARLVMDPKPGDQINALQPPVLQTIDGRRLMFGGSAVTKDSAYFVGDVVLMLEAGALPIEGTLITSYCRAGE